MTPTPFPEDMVAALEEGIHLVLADMQPVLERGRREQPEAFAGIGCAEFGAFVGRASRLGGGEPFHVVGSRASETASERDRTIAWQVLQRLAAWPEDRDSAAKAWELVLSAVLIDPRRHVAV